MDDIEDLVSDTAIRRNRNDSLVTIRARQRQKHRSHCASSSDSDHVTALPPPPPPPVCDSVIPGTQTIYVRTWGCTHNSSDSEYMTGLLAHYGYNITDDPKCADLWLLNSCTVKSPAEQHFKNEIEAARALGKHVVVAGCVPQAASRAADYLLALSAIGVQQIDRVVEVVEETLKGHTVRLFGQRKELGKKLGGAPLLLPKVRKNRLIEIIAISTGCLNQCTYCKTKHARGELGSYPIDEIVARARQAFADGVCELWLTSEDTGAYGRDLGTDLPQLLRTLLPHIPDSGMLRLGMTNPPYILDHLQEIAEILRHPRVYSFLHIPVQSGCDRVLDDMRREYTVADFCRVVDYLTEHVPGLTICTDIICGFPTETEDNFDDTLQLCARYRFPSLFINQFYPRPGTVAARMKRLPTDQVKSRSRQLTQLFHSYRPYDHLLGSRHRVLVTEVAHDQRHYVAHNKQYQQVLIPFCDQQLMGRFVDVQIVSTCKFSMTGALCDGATRCGVRHFCLNLWHKMAGAAVAAGDAVVTVSGCNSEGRLTPLVGRAWSEVGRAERALLAVAVAIVYILLRFVCL